MAGSSLLLDLRFFLILALVVATRTNALSQFVDPDNASVWDLATATSFDVTWTYE
jgi:hypothetical protein